MIIKILNKLFKRKEIKNCDRDIYLIRWYVIKTKRFGLYIHKFLRSDEDRALHDHPWNFIVMPIWQGYIEHSTYKKWKCGSKDCPVCGENATQKKRIYPIISTRYRDRYYRHRVELINNKPAWSLFIRFQDKRNWGFWEDNKFIPNQKWWTEKCE